MEIFAHIIDFIDVKVSNIQDVENSKKANQKVRWSWMRTPPRLMSGLLR